MSTISVSGGGYVGLVTAACLAELGHDVTCIEIDETRLHDLHAGRLPIYEPGLGELVGRNMGEGRLRFTNSYSRAIPEAEFAFIAVQTPPMADGSADTRYVFECLEDLIEYAAPGLIVVVKSTVPVGTGDRIRTRLADLGREDIGVASNPEFLRQGSAVMDFLKPDRMAVGSSDSDVAAAVAGLYRGIDAPMVICGQRSAELAKYGANALLATRISFMNEIAAICESLEADVEEVAQVMRLDARIGPYYLRPGLGWGGSCFPKDVLALSSIARLVNQSTPIIDGAYQINQRQRDEAYHKIRGAIDGQEEPVVGLLGLAFKPNTDDLRQSPAIDVVSRLVSEGIRVQAHDPVAMDKARMVLPELQYCSSPIEVTHGADITFLATEWREFQDIDWTVAAERMRHRVVLDGRNVLDREHLLSLGYTYLSFGRSVMGAPSRESVAIGDG